MIAAVWHEWAALKEQLDALLASPPEHAVRVALYEAVLIHERALIAFFFPRTQQETDVFAEHYGWTPSGAEPGVFGFVYTAANKRVAHITTYRTSLKDRVADAALVDVRDLLDQLLGEFKAVTEPKVSTVKTYFTMSPRDSLHSANTVTQEYVLQGDGTHPKLWKS